MDKREPPSFDPPGTAKPNPDDDGLMGAKGDPAEGKRGPETDDRLVQGGSRKEDRPAP